MHRQLGLFDETRSARDWEELPAEIRTEVLRLLSHAASRMLRNPEEAEHDGCDHDDEDQDPPP